METLVRFMLITVPLIALGTIILALKVWVVIWVLRGLGVIP